MREWEAYYAKAKLTRAGRRFYDQLGLWINYNRDVHSFSGNIVRIKELCQDASDQLVDQNWELLKPSFPFDPVGFVKSEYCKRFDELENKIQQVEDEEENSDDL